MCETEVAWAAGFFDGEGWVGGGRTGGRSIRVSITQTDRFVLDRFRNAVDAGTVHGPFVNEANRRRGIGGKPFWAYRAGSRTGITQVHERLRPFLSPAKVGQFEAAMIRLGPDYSKICRTCGRVKTGSRTDSSSLR